MFMLRAVKEMTPLLRFFARFVHAAIGKSEAVPGIIDRIHYSTIIMYGGMGGKRIENAR